MKRTCPNLVPHRLFSQLTPEDFNPTRLEEVLWECGVESNLEESEFHYTPELRDRCGSGVHSYQMPCQLAEFLTFLYRNREEIRINSYLELGVHKGGTFYIVDSFFRVINPDFQGSVAVDRNESMFEFRNYKNRFGSVEFVRSYTLDWTPPKVFDLVFVDDDHFYEHLVKEFPIYKPYARYMAFHDVVNQWCSGVVRFWNEIKNDYQHWEFTRQYIPENSMMGIGLIRVV